MGKLIYQQRTASKGNYLRESDDGRTGQANVHAHDRMVYRNGNRFFGFIWKRRKIDEETSESEDYAKILATYPDFQIENIWKSLFTMTSLFSNYAKQVADNLQFRQNMEEQENAKEYLHPAICKINHNPHIIPFNFHILIFQSTLPSKLSF